jgi:hypothetical protein
MGIAAGMHDFGKTMLVIGSVLLAGALAKLLWGRFNST